MPKQPSNAQIKAEVMRLRKVRRNINLEKESLRKRELKMRLVERKSKIERAKLVKELVDLRNPRSAEFRKNIRRAGKGILKGILLVGEDLEARRRARVKRGRKK